MYHVTARGDRREAIYRDDPDRQAQLAVIAQAMQRFDAAVLAYCQMGNHVHLVLRTRAANLSRVTRHVNGVYTQAFNRRHGLTGGTFSKAVQGHPGRLRRPLRLLGRRGLVERARIQRMDRGAFSDFFRGAAGAPERFALVLLTDEDRRLFGTTATELWLSRLSLDEHKMRHPEIGPHDYLCVPRMLREGEVWAGPQDRRFVLLTIAGKPYRAALKIDQSRQEAWFLSLFISGKQKPPKGAVRVR